MNKHYRLLVGMLLTAASGLASASDQNLFGNGDFSTANGITGWTAFPPPNGPMSWSTDDALGNSGSGSLELHNAGPDGGYLPAYVGTCFAVTPGAAYTIGGESRLIPGASPILYFDYCAAYVAPNCVGANTGGINVPTIPQSYTWTVWVPSSGILPADASSVRCEFGLFDYMEYSAGARIDNLFFNSAAPTTPVKLQSFEVR